MVPVLRKKEAVISSPQRICNSNLQIALHRNTMTVIQFFTACPSKQSSELPTFGALPFPQHSSVPEHILLFTVESRNLYHSQNSLYYSTIQLSCQCLCLTLHDMKYSALSLHPHTATVLHSGWYPSSKAPYHPRLHQSGCGALRI